MMVRNAHLRTAILSLLAAALVFALFSPADAAPARKAVVHKVIYDWENHVIRVHVKPGQPGERPQYLYDVLNDNRFYIDILNSKVASKLDASVSKGFVTRVKRNQFNPTTSRVVIKFEKKVDPKITWHPGSDPYYLIDVSGGAYDPSKAASSGTNGKKFRIMIDPGHGGRDPGTRGPNGEREKHITLDIAKRLEKKLKGRGDVEVKLTRDRDKTISLSKRRQMADDWNADIFISIHANGASSTHLNQTEIYYHDRKGYGLAQAIRRDLVSELQSRDGGVRYKNLAVLRSNAAKYGSVLVEPYYLTSRNGSLNLGSPLYKDKIAKGIYTSIDTFLDKKSRSANDNE